MVRKIRLLAIGLVCGLFAIACASTDFNIPAVTGGEPGNTLPGKVVWHDLLTDTPEQTRAFYNGLFGWEFKPLSPGDINYELIYHRGVAIGGMVDQNRLPNEADISQWVMLLSVEDAEAAAQEVVDAGGEVLTPPTSLGDRGTIAIITDAQGALLALLETGGDPLDHSNDPVAGNFLWNELWTSDIAAATEFYRALAPYGVETPAIEGLEQNVDARILTTAGRPRLGIRSRPFDDLRPRWVNYLMVEDEAALAAILSRVEALGGEVLVEATPRPLGGHVALITGPSGAGIALQTWSPGKVSLTQEEQE